MKALGASLIQEKEKCITWHIRSEQIARDGLGDVCAKKHTCLGVYKKNYSHKQRNYNGRYAAVEEAKVGMVPTNSFCNA